MTVYYGVLAGLTAFYALLRIGGRSVVKDRVFLVTAFGVLAVLSACRYAVGVDYNMIYSPQYEEVLADPAGYSIFETRWEPGFVLLEKLIATLSPNYQMLYVVTSVLLMALFAAAYWRLSPNPFVSVFLFLTLSQFYCSMNFIRQTLAGAICLFAIPFLQKRKFFPYLLIVLAASLFHTSALILIPFFFVNLIPLTNPWWLGAACLGTAGIYFNTRHILGFVTKYWYKHHYLESEHMVLTFDPRFALATLAVFLLLLLFSRRLLRRDKSNVVYINYAFYAFFFTLMGTRHSILDRLSLYFALAAPISLSILLEELGRRDGQPIWRLERGKLRADRKPFAVWAAAGVAVVAGSLTLHHFALTMDHHGVTPYRLIFTQPFYAEYREWLDGQKTAEDDPLELPADEPPL